MSRIGKNPVIIPTGVTVDLKDKELTVKWPKGELKFTHHEQILVKIEDNKVVVSRPNDEKLAKGELKFTNHEQILVKIEDNKVIVSRPNDEKLAKSLHWTTRTIVANMVEWVTKWYEKRLEIHGVGYRANVSGKKLNLTLGFSHPVELEIPAGLTVAMDEKAKNEIIVTGIDKEIVGQFSANIRSYKKPEPYKGKGIRYKWEYVRRKAGKAAKSE